MKVLRFYLSTQIVNTFLSWPLKISHKTKNKREIKTKSPRYICALLCFLSVIFSVFCCAFEKFSTYINPEADLFVESTTVRLFRGQWRVDVVVTSNSLLLLWLNSHFASIILFSLPNFAGCFIYFGVAKFILYERDGLTVCGCCWYCCWLCCSPRFVLLKVFAFVDIFIKIERI